MNKKIKLSLLGTLIAASALAITLPIVSCSSSSSTQLIVDKAIMDEVQNDVTNSLKGKMEEAKTYQNQKALAAEWSIDSEIPTEELNIIKQKIKFKDGNLKDVPYDDAIKSITFASETKIGELDDIIKGPELKFNFNPGYTSDILFKVDELGVVAPIGLTIDDEVLSKVTIAITESLKNEMDKKQTFKDQKELVDQWEIGSEIPSYALNSIKSILEFKEDDKLVSYDDAVNSITFDTETILGSFNSNIYGPKLKVNFNVDFIGDLSIEVGSLGKVAARLIKIENKDKSIEFVKKFYKEKLDAMRGYEEQKDYIDNIGEEFEAFDEFVNIIQFVDANGFILNGSDVIKKIFLINPPSVSGPEQDILGGKLAFELNESFISNGIITLEIGNVTKSKPALRKNLSYINNEAEEKIILAFSDSYKKIIDDLPNFSEQRQYIIDNMWQNLKIDDLVFDLMKPYLNFTNVYEEEFKFDQVIDSIVFPDPLAAPFLGEIFTIRFQINFKDGFKYNSPSGLSSSIAYKVEITQLKS